MAEQVQTGGLMKFSYNLKESTKQNRLSDAEKRELEEAYDKYYERKKREKRTRKAIWIIVALIIIIGLFFVVKRYL